MKKGTIARIAVYGLTLAVILGMLLPILGMAFSEEAETGIGVPSVYDLDESNVDTLDMNIDVAVNGATGFQVSYGTTTEPVDPNNTKKLAEKIIASGAETATVYDPTGKVAMQDGIVYSNSIYQTNVTGVMIPGVEKFPMGMGIWTVVIDNDKNVVFKANSETIINDQGMFITMQIPMIPLIAGMAAGYQQGFVAEAGMTDIFEMNLKMLGNITQDIPYTVTTTEGNTVFNFDTTMCGDSTGTIGDIKFVSTNHDGLTITCQGSVSSHLAELAEAGPVVISSEGKSYEMSSEDTAGLSEVFKILEASA